MYKSNIYDNNNNNNNNDDDDDLLPHPLKLQMAIRAIKRPT